MNIQSPKPAPIELASTIETSSSNIAKPKAFVIFPLELSLAEVISLAREIDKNASVEMPSRSGDNRVYTDKPFAVISAFGAYVDKHYPVKADFSVVDDRQKDRQKSIGRAA